MSNQSFFGGTGVTNNQTDAIEASVNNAAASEAAALVSKNTAANTNDSTVPAEGLEMASPETIQKGVI